MRTNIELDDALMDDLMTYTGLATKKAVVDLALRELRQRVLREALLRDLPREGTWEGDLVEMRRGRERSQWPAVRDAVVRAAAEESAPYDAPQESQRR